VGGRSDRRPAILETTRRFSRAPCFFLLTTQMFLVRRGRRRRPLAPISVPHTLGNRARQGHRPTASASSNREGRPSRIRESLIDYSPSDTYWRALPAAPCLKHHAFLRFFFSAPRRRAATILGKPVNGNRAPGPLYQLGLSTIWRALYGRDHPHVPPLLPASPHIVWWMGPPCPGQRATGPLPKANAGCLARTSFVKQIAPGVVLPPLPVSSSPPSKSLDWASRLIIASIAQRPISSRWGVTPARQKWRPASSFSDPSMTMAGAHPSAAAHRLSVIGGLPVELTREGRPPGAAFQFSATAHIPGLAGKFVPPCCVGLVPSINK